MIINNNNNNKKKKKKKKKKATLSRCLAVAHVLNFKTSESWESC